MNEFLREYQQDACTWKDKVQYGVATTSFIAGITMGYISYLTGGTISGDVLGFIGECFTLTGGIFGITLYIRNKVSAAGVYVADKMSELTKTYNKDNSYKDEYNDDVDVAEKPLENRR